MKKKVELSKNLLSSLYDQEAFRYILLLILSVVKIIFLKLCAELWYAWCSQGTKARKCFNYLNSVICRWPIILILPTTTCFFLFWRTVQVNRGCPWAHSPRAAAPCPKPASRLASELTGCKRHETKTSYLAKSQYHFFVHKSYHILYEWTSAELVTMLWGKY